MSEPVVVHLEEFLRTGDLGPVRMGMTRDELLQLIGEPERLGGASRQNPQPGIWKYGDLELHFDADTHLLSLIYADGFTVPRGALGLTLEPGWIRGGLSLEAGMARLQESELSGALRVPDYDPGHAVLELESGVLLGFNVEGGPGRAKSGLVFFSQGPR